LSSVVIKSVDAAAVRRRTDEFARDLLALDANVDEIIVFGSFANDSYAPGSDLDLFVVLREASDSPRNRIGRYRPELFPVPVDVFAFTRAEMAELAPSPLLSAVEQSSWRYRR
jgi:predicted nucleotidyltransferase